MNDIEALANRILMIGNGRLLYDGNLNELRNRFGTSRTITADYREHSTPPVIPGSTMLSWSPERAVIRINTENTSVSDAIAQLSGQVELIDVAIEAKPIEEVVLQLYKEYQI
jgi:ABC-2 type transport system ATP-binding protein